jgi:RAD51-like protein 3
MDTLLAGGLRRGEVVELSGPPASGKTQVRRPHPCACPPTHAPPFPTQLCLSAAAAAALRGHSVVFVDTTRGFSATRLAQLVSALASGQALSQEVQRRALMSVRCTRVFDVHSALQLVEQLRAGGGHNHEAAQQADRPALLVVDSVSALLSPLLTTKHAQGGGDD